MATALVVTAVAAPADEPPPPPFNPLYVDPIRRNFDDNPNLLRRLTASPHRYYRFVNVPFSQEVCRRFAARNALTPTVNLHGDAHLEQYAITPGGRGLTDFDDSSTGPAVIDLVRFAGSLTLAGQELGLSPEITAEGLSELFRGYRLALANPGLVATEPDLVPRVKRGFSDDRSVLLAWADSLMERVPEAETRAVTEALGPYAEAMRASQPQLPDDFFAVQRLGLLRLGIGSALDRKYLARVRGLTDDPGDDPLLEIKPVRNLTAIDCVSSASKQDPLRILVASARIANVPYEQMGYLRIGERTLWVHAWSDAYHELAIGETLTSADDLFQVAFDVGTQLGRGHVHLIAAPFDLQLRREQRRRFDREVGAIREAAEELAALTVLAWRRFTAEMAATRGAGNTARP